MFLTYKSRYILFPISLIIFDFEAIMMIPEKEKDSTNSSELKCKIIVHNFPIRYPMTIYIDGLIGLHS